jgi:hypothetical protein
MTITVYPYNLNIPNAPDDPADDQPSMQVNTNSIGGLIAVDHIGFGAANNGAHNQVSFAANQPAPGLRGCVGNFFSNLSAGKSVPFWQNATAISPVVLGSLANPTVFAVNGLASLGGIIFQWGLTTVTKNALTTITFPITFATVFNVQMSPLKSGSGTDDAWINAPATNGNFVVNNNSNSITQVYWFAIGM